MKIPIVKNYFHFLLISFRAFFKGSEFFGHGPGCCPDRDQDSGKKVFPDPDKRIGSETLVVSVQKVACLKGHGVQLPPPGHVDLS